jgi:hypothetical protein
MTPRDVTTAGYGLLVAAAVALTLLARRGDSRLATGTAFLASLMRTPLGRWTVLLGWLWLGWHTFVR